MIINYNGKEIELEDNDNMDDMFNLICVCGHKLSSHSFVHAYGTTKRWITSQCTTCRFTEKDEDHPQGFICEQFRIGPGKNDARWFNYPGLKT